MVEVLYPKLFTKAKGRLMILLILNGIADILINSSSGMVIIILAMEYLGVAYSLKCQVQKKDPSKHHATCLKIVKWTGIISIITTVVFGPFPHTCPFFFA
jgi:hypothetical protein